VVVTCCVCGQDRECWHVPAPIKAAAGIPFPLCEDCRRRVATISPTSRWRVTPPWIATQPAAAPPDATGVVPRLQSRCRLRRSLRG
jgi:hypothetical protein